MILLLAAKLAAVAALQPATLWPINDVSSTSVCSIRCVARTRPAQHSSRCRAYEVRLAADDDDDGGESWVAPANSSSIMRSRAASTFIVAILAQFLRREERLDEGSTELSTTLELFLWAV